MSSKRAKNTTKCLQRVTSNAFPMFDQSQIQEFKEVLNMIDQIRDGSIDKDDLHDMFASLGWALSNVYLYEYLEAMMNEAPGPVNFTMFLTVFGEKLNGTNPEDVICNAFACFDEEGTGKSICLTGEKLMSRRGNSLVGRLSKSFLYSLSTSERLQQEQNGAACSFILQGNDVHPMHTHR
uniref:EF-hand domain-containing protein n=1 Tax=Oryzias latipes TaxID=8090 RepID=A0A3P9H475_ORYLA